MGMTYLGNGFISGIPARDLTDEEVKRFGAQSLIKTGLYAPEKPAKQSSKAAAAEEADDDPEDDENEKRAAGPGEDKREQGPKENK